MDNLATEEEIPEQIKKYIITDPAYIMTDIEYEKEILRKSDPYSSSKKMNQEFPFNAQYKKNGTMMTIYFIQRTPNGSGTYSFRNQEIGNDTGTLCIAENRKGWDEQFGAILETLTEAKNVFPYIIKHF